MIRDNARPDWAHDLILPTLLFAALGGMSWAVRGCSGFGSLPGCIFAGVMWGAAWWFLARDPSGAQPRRYASGWIVLAVMVGVGLSGARGWMQWPSFFEGRLQTNAAEEEWVPIPNVYGFAWMFIAGMPWAGIGSCLLAWCGSLYPTRVWHWAIRIACGVGGYVFAGYLFDNFPQYFLPLYESIESRYKDLATNPSLERVINDNRQAITHLGCYLGFLLFEVGRRDWKNVVLITTVGVLNGIGWQALQNWKWAEAAWPDARFNFWRCWESSGGISIGIAFGIAYFLVNRPMTERERAIVSSNHAVAGPNFEWLLIFCGLATVLHAFAGPRFRGWDHIYYSIIYAFAGVYYLLHRRQPYDARLAGSAWDWAGLEWGAVGLVVALIAGELIFGWEREQIANRLMYFNGVLALGFAYYFARRETLEKEKARTTPLHGDPNLERLGLYLGVLFGLGMSVRNGLKGWFNLYLGDERYWDQRLWQVFGPVCFVCLMAIMAWVLFRPLRPNFRGDLHPRAYAIIWLVLVVQNVIAQLVTGPHTQWSETAFSIYYVLLLAITGVIVHHHHERLTEPVREGEAQPR